ncbi:MAG: hypothetical protein COB46_03350 [Rhodospirillaceae bacterium]|nr:MAG: hypothetical protein COB46_03350 [Rhodospirillaceae bacterium]
MVLFSVHYAVTAKFTEKRHKIRITTVQKQSYLNYVGRSKGICEFFLNFVYQELMSNAFVLGASD